MVALWLLPPVIILNAKSEKTYINCGLFELPLCGEERSTQWASYSSHLKLQKKQMSDLSYSLRVATNC